MYPKFDPVASLQVWAVEKPLGGCVLRVPPVPASEWLPVLMGQDLMGVVDLLEGFDLADALMADLFTASELQEALMEIVEEAAGRNAIAAFVIAGVAAERWDVIGADLVRAGVRFDQISIGAALDAIYGSLCRGLDEKGMERFNLALQDPSSPSSKAPLRGGRGFWSVPASAEQYVRVRPKTVPRRPQDRPDVSNEQPMPQPPPLDDSALGEDYGSPEPGAGNRSLLGA